MKLAGADACGPSTRRFGFQHKFVLEGILCAALGLLSLAITFRSSAEPAGHPRTTAFDQYGNLCWEDEQARLDNFAIQLQHFSDHTGDLVVYAGRLSCPDEAKYRAERARKWIIKRGIPADRIKVRDGGYREEVETILWAVPKDSVPPTLDPTLTRSQVSIRKRCVDKVFAKVVCVNR